ncbi:HAD-IA family hydrolase [Salipiger mucosus]|uniref:2-haloalkanoic acid dehalogenase n=1 Tax=Salipiger mucosus DSM 16094 TaxID=1123237 RepID=S9S0N3_9RHOB|nr:HAD-IA family hydrolase [Salipiger mucosus]EPX79794.1 2-haloalkanoic acid dehalogenase [Salipiger mucosus DSM 16094]
MDFSRFKVLTFDVVGTCVDFEAGILGAFRRIGGPAAEGLSDDQIFKPYLEGRERNYDRMSEAFKGVYLHVARELGFPETESAARDFQLSVLEWPAFPDSVAALARLRRRYRLVAMTNGDRTAFSAHNHTLGRPFHEGVTCDDTGCTKPDPRFFAYNLGRQSAAGVARHEILHVAQSQYHDIGIAKSLGYATAWIERRHDQPGYGATPDPASLTEPDIRVTSLGALADAIFGEGA